MLQYEIYLLKYNITKLMSLKFNKSFFKIHEIITFSLKRKINANKFNSIITNLCVCEKKIMIYE